MISIYLLEDVKNHENESQVYYVRTHYQSTQYSLFSSHICKRSYQSINLRAEIS